MKKTIILATVAVLFTAPAIAETVKMGVLLSFTGPIESLTPDMAAGAGMIAGAKETTALLIDRHEENLASAGMMRKAGFVTLKTYLDLERRDYGSRKTTVMAYGLNGD